MESVSLVDMLDNELGRISKRKTRLDNTSKFDPHTTKLDQVCNNLVNNAVTINDGILDDIACKKSEITIPYLKDINSDENNENDFIECRIFDKRKTFTDFNEYVKSKYGYVNQGIQELSRLMMDAVAAQPQLQQQATTTITFNGKTKLATLVVKRFAKISKEIEKHQSHMFRSDELKKIISDALDKPDERTIRAYLESLKNYAKRNQGMYASYEYLYNMHGFKDTVSRLREQRGLA